MQSKVVRLYNRSAAPCSILVQGNQLTIGSYCEMPVVDEVAEAFVAKYPQAVEVVNENSIAPVQVIEKPKTVWVANVTGDPRYPAKVPARLFKDKHWTREMVDNPVLKPMPLSATEMPDWSEYMSASGLMSKRTGTKRWLLNPFRRMEMQPAKAAWFLNHMPKVEVVGSPIHILAARVCRAPTDFEPDHTWEYDDLIAYMHYIDTLAALPQTETKIRAASKRTKLTDEQVEEKIADEKRKLLTRLYYYVVDPKVAIPSRKEFAEYLHGQRGTEVQASEIEKLADELTAEA